jgi:hypothetical protein
MLLSMSSGVINHDVAALQPWQNRALAAGRLLLQPVQQVLVGSHALPRAQLLGAPPPPRMVRPDEHERQQLHSPDQVR